MDLQPFQKRDLPLAANCDDDTRWFVATAFDRRGERLYRCQATYGSVIWAKRRLKVPLGDDHLKHPIGLVLKGALEVTERFLSDSVARWRTTAILRPGGFFGLFEAFGGLDGLWEITAGVQRFLVTNPLGGLQRLRGQGWGDVSKSQLQTLRQYATADYSYSSLVHHVLARSRRASKWTCTFVLFDLDRFRGEADLMRILHEKAIAQLASLARQNPPDALFEVAVHHRETANLLRFGATLDAMLTDDIPVLSAYSGTVHDEYGPFGQVKRAVGRLLRPQTASRRLASDHLDRAVHLWIPDYWSHVKPRGALYVDALAKKFSMKSADAVLYGKAMRPKLRSGTVIKPVGKPGDEFYGLRVKKRGVRKPMLIQRLGSGNGEGRIPAGLSKNLFHGVQNDYVYGWPSNLCSGFFLRPLP